MEFRNTFLFVSLVLAAKHVKEPSKRGDNPKLLNIRTHLKVFNEFYKIRNHFSDAIKMHFKNIPSFNDVELSKFDKFREEFKPLKETLEKKINSVKEKEEEVKKVLKAMSNKLFSGKIKLNEGEKNSLELNFEEFTESLEIANNKFNIVDLERNLDKDVSRALSKLRFLGDCNPKDKDVPDILHSMSPADKVYISYVELDKLYKSLEKLKKICMKYSQ